MANPLFNSLNRSNPQQGMNIPEFMNKVRGMSPRDLINRAVSTNNISQDQLNAIQQQAQKVAGQFDQFRNMFGF